MLGKFNATQWPENPHKYLSHIDYWCLGLFGLFDGLERSRTISYRQTCFYVQCVGFSPPGFIDGKWSCSIKAWWGGWNRTTQRNCIAGSGFSGLPVAVPCSIKNFICLIITMRIQWVMPPLKQGLTNCPTLSHILKSSTRPNPWCWLADPTVLHGFLPLAFLFTQSFSQINPLQHIAQELNHTPLAHENVTEAKVATRTSSGL